MSFSNLLIKNSIYCGIRHVVPLQIVSRSGHTIRGKRPGVARTLEQRLEELNAQDPELSALVNIGFPKLRSSRSQELKKRLEHLKARRSNPQIEKIARSNQLLIDLDEVQREHANTGGQFHLRVIANHYGIFDDLFGAAYFVPRVPLTIKYEVSADSFVPVYHGNLVTPSEASKAPLVEFDGTLDIISGEKSKTDSYWTLVATNPDGCFEDNQSECLHWLVANIPNGDINKGEVLANYLPPFPPKGLGYQRFVYILYKQNGKVDFSSYKLEQNDYANLKKRVFKTLDFYRKYQDDITPAGLSFFQTSWDRSITSFYHDILDMKEPIYEYDFPKAYLSDQKFFPLKQPFNLYMDKHRDIKQINKEFLEKKLAKTHPFEGPEPKLRFPNAHPIRDVPSWLRTEMKKERLNTGRVQDY